MRIAYVDSAYGKCVLSKYNTSHCSYLGIDSVRLNPIKRQFKHLYAYTEVATTAVDTCDVKLMDDCANVILLIQGFRVRIG